MSNNSISKINLQWFAEDDDLTVEAIKSFLESNKERPDVAEYLQSLQVEKELNSETVNAYLETPEGKVTLQPRLDRYANIAIKTHDEKQAPVIEAKIKAGINEGIRKLHPEETEADRQVRELREDMERMRKDGEYKERKNAILMEANTRHIPKELVEGIDYPSVEHFVNVATIWDKVIADEKTKTINEYVAMNAHKPKGGQDKNEGPDFKTMSKEERFAYFKRQAEQRDAGNVAS